MKLNEIFNRNFALMLVGVAVIWAISIVAFFFLNAIFDLIVLLPIFSVDLSICLLMTHYLGKRRYMNATPSRLSDFFFGFLPPMIVWLLSLTGLILLGVITNEVSFLVYSVVAWFHLAPFLFLSIFLGLTSFLLGRFHRNLGIMAMTKVGGLVALLMLFLPALAITGIILYAVGLDVGRLIESERTLIYLASSIVLPLIAVSLIKRDLAWSKPAGVGKNPKKTKKN